MKKIFMYCANRKPSGGIAIYEYNHDTGKFHFLCRQLQEESLHIGALCLDVKRKLLYLTDETSEHPEFRSGGGGRVLAYCINPMDGTLSRINENYSYGSKPSYLTLDESGSYILLTNHGGRNTVTDTYQDEKGTYHLRTHHDESSVVLFELREDGDIGQAVQIKKLTGEGPRAFQQSAHAHFIERAPGKELYVVCDKGADKVRTYLFDKENKELIEGPEYDCKPGSAPRYAVFHPKYQILYVNHEAEEYISVFKYNKNGRLTHVEDVSSHPEGSFEVPKDALIQSDICISPDGKYLYAGLRLVDAILVYRIEEKTGRLTLHQTMKTLGGVRGFDISPDGQFFIAAFMEEKRVDIYRICEDGSLIDTLEAFDEDSPGVITFVSCVCE